MRRLIKIFIVLILIVPMIAAATKMYLDTEKKYAFTAENLATTIPEFVEDEKKQEALAKKWIESMDPDTGMVSIADIFAACRAGGFNTYKQAGFEQCRAFIVKLLENAEAELDEDFLNGFCPGLDEKGKNPNALATLTDKTRIGDFCSTSHIYAGEVTFRKGYNCTCTAYACNPGYEFKSGRCVTIVADGQGNCLRKEFDKSPTLNTTAKAVDFCQEYATKNKCKYTNAIMYHSKSKVVCNGTIAEVDDVKAGMLQHRDNLIAGLKYYEVCGQHRGKTGKKEYCVENVFGDVDTGLNEAAGLSQLYAKDKHGKTIYCDTKYREKSNDDYMKCATLEKDTFYEFRFDDVSESNDDVKFADTIMGIAAIYGYKSSSNVISGPCTTKIQNAAKKMGMTTSSWSNNKCALWRGVQITSNKNLNSKLRSIDGLDCTIGKSIQTQGSTEVRNKLLSYIRTQGFVVTDFECDNSYGTVYNGVLSGSDDVLTCRVSGTFNGKRYNKQPVDFIFDDMSEGKKYQQKAGDQGLNCIAYNGNFDGHYCRKLTKEECFQLEKEMLAELKKNGKYTGDTDLVDWDESAGACELNDAQVANNINKVGKYTAIVGLTVAGAFTGGASATVAVSLMAVELAGVAGEIYVDRKQELLPQEWADAFLAESRKCNSSSCAESTLRSNFQKIAQANDKLNRDVLNDVDTEMARLAEKIPNERLQQIIETSEPPSCWDTWECQRWIFTGMQFASLGVAVGKGLVKLTGVFAKKAAAAATKTGAKAATSAASHVDDLQDMMKLSSEEFSKKYSSRFADIGIKEERTATGGFRYRDTKTGQFVSRENVGRRLRGEQEVRGGASSGTSSGSETGNTGGGSNGSSGNGTGNTGNTGNTGGNNSGGNNGGGTTGGATGGAANGTPPGSGNTGPHGGNGGGSGGAGNTGHTGGSSSGNTGPHNTGNTGGSTGGNSGPHNTGNTGGTGSSGSTGNTGGSGSGGSSSGNTGPHGSNGGGGSGSTGGNAGGSSGSTGSGPHNNGGGSTGNTGGTNGGANSGGNTGANGANSGNSGPHNTGNAGGAGHGASGGGTGGYHADLDNYLNSYTSNPTKAKRQLLNKYHPDKVAGYNDPELNRLTGDITQKINGGIENLSAAEKLELSRKMAEVDRRIEQAENVARSARQAEEAARRAGSASGANNGGSTSRSARNPNTNNGNTGNVNNTGRYDIVPVNNNRAMVSGEATMPRTEALMGSEVPRLGSGNTTEVPRLTAGSTQEVPRLTAGSATEETRLLGAGSHADDAVVPKVEQVKETEIPRLGAGVANNSRKMTDDVVMDIYNEGGYIADPNYAYGSWERRWPGLLEYNGGEISNADNIRQIYSRVDAAERSFNKYKNVLKGDEEFERAYNVFLRDKDTLMNTADDLQRVMMAK